MAANELGDLIHLVLAASKDSMYQEAVEKMQQAFQELILTEAASRREKTAALIHAMAKIDIEVSRFKRVYSSISNQLTPEAKSTIDSYLKAIDRRKKDIINEKNALKTKNRSV